uniref:Uncharacterized protein n=1 Tax=Felis catus TaxID=9685 RepID=A0ABI7X4L2_FELCA
MKATHRSRWLSRSVSGLSSAGTNRRRRPSIPAPDLKSGSSESTVSTAVMPASLRWSGSAAAAAPPRVTSETTEQVRRWPLKVNLNLSSYTVTFFQIKRIYSVATLCLKSQTKQMNCILKAQFTAGSKCSFLIFFP